MKKKPVYVLILLAMAAAWQANAEAAKLKEMEALLLSEMKRLDDPHRFWDQQAE